MLEQLLKHLKNWFRVRNNVDGIYSGTYTIESGSITLPFLQNGQYFRIVGSVFNDGLYIYGESIKDGNGNDIELTEETFSGAVWALALPKAIISLAKEIEEWQAKYGDIVTSPYSSESFGGYSYSKSTSGNAEDGSSTSGWEGAFRTRLNQWRKIRED